jgi:hypothetical protein
MPSRNDVIGFVDGERYFRSIQGVSVNHVMVIRERHMRLSIPNHTN